MNFSVCIDSIFPGRDVYSKILETKRLGFDAFEFWGWWDKDIEQIEAAKDESGLTVAAFCTRMVSLADAGRREEYLNGLRQSLEVARRLKCRTLISQVGADIPGVPREQLIKNFITGLKAALPLLENAGVTLAFEPLNPFDHKGYLISSSYEAFEITREVNHPLVKVLYDVYHQQRTEGNIINQIKNNASCIAHYHAAGCPARGELDEGELNYASIFDTIKKTGYRGFVGLEYFTKNIQTGLERIRTAYN